MPRLFEKYYKKPFKLDSFSVYIFDKDNNMTIMMEYDELELTETLENILNDVPFKPLTEKFHSNGCDVFDSNNKYRFCVRGWGRLTSPNCLNLDEETAIKIQDSMVDYVVKKLNGEPCE